MTCVKKFVEFHPCGDNESLVWKYYLRAVDAQTAQCKICKKEFKTKGGSTKGLHVHLNSKHSINLIKRKHDDAIDAAIDSSAEKNNKHCSGNEKEKKVKVTDYFVPVEDNSLSAVLARMCAKDSFTFRVFCTSSDLRVSLRARGFNNIPTSPNTIRSIVFKYFEKIKSAKIVEFKNLKAKNVKFSITFDEWKSMKNRKYLNVNVHHFIPEENKNKFHNLGLVRIRNSLPAEKCIELVQKKLKEYELDFENDIKDVVAITTDGCNVMKRVGNLIKALQQLCLAHGIHLAVTDVLYEKKKTNKNTPSPELEAEDETEEESEDESDEEDEEETEEDNDWEEVGELDYDINYVEEVVLADADVSRVIKKLRKIVKMFRRSSLKNDILQKYVKETENKEKGLILDVKTRWNSLVDMLERFISLHDCIQKALIDLKSKISFTDEDFKVAEAVFLVLQPIKVSVEALCRRDANLITADASLKFIMDKLRKIDNEFSIKMQTALEIRIKERRTDVSGVLQYLHSGKKTSDDKLFPTPATANIKKFIKDFVSKFSTRESLEVAKITPEANGSEKEDDPPEVVTSTPAPSSLKDELDKLIKETLKPPEKNADKIDATSALATKITKEMAAFEENGKRGTILQFVYLALIGIQPTSVEAERAFSAAGGFCTKRRTNLGDKTLSVLCFLRSYFQTLN